MHAWSARLVPAVALHACVLLCYFFGRRWLGERPAFWGSLALSLAPGFASMGRLLMISLGWELLVTLLFRPALLARSPVERRRR